MICIFRGPDCFNCPHTTPSSPSDGVSGPSEPAPWFNNISPDSVDVAQCLKELSEERHGFISAPDRLDVRRQAGAAGFDSRLPVNRSLARPSLTSSQNVRTLRVWTLNHNKFEQFGGASLKIEPPKFNQPRLREDCTSEMKELPGLQDFSCLL